MMKIVSKIAVMTAFCVTSTFALAQTSVPKAPMPAPKAPAPVATPAPVPAPQVEPVREQVIVDRRQDQRIIAVPAFATPAVTNVAGSTTQALGRQMADIISSNLSGSGLYKPMGPGAVRAIAMVEVNAPQYPYWQGKGAEAVVHGMVEDLGDGTLKIGCWLYDVEDPGEQARQGFIVQPKDWRRAAHKCADMIYSKMTGEAPFFDSRVAYIAESGPKGKRVKRLAIMDSDGANHDFITNGQSIAVTPRFSPDYKEIVYVSYLGERVRVYRYNVATKHQKLVIESSNPTFSPRFSPDGRYILYSMAIAGNTDIYRIAAEGGTPRRLTTAPGIDTGGSYSPDGKRITFESDRSGAQQIYVMNADGSDQQRISFGGGTAATPEWSPRGDLIAFTRMGGGAFRIATMTPSGSGERLLTNSWQDEAPSWSPNGRVIQFFRTSQGNTGASSVWQIDVTGISERKLPTPSAGSDPAWGPILP
jgi:TolB protein